MEIEVVIGVIGLAVVLVGGIWRLGRREQRIEDRIEANTETHLAHIEYGARRHKETLRLFKAGFDDLAAWRGRLEITLLQLLKANDIDPGVLFGLTPSGGSNGEDDTDTERKDQDHEDPG